MLNIIKEKHKKYVTTGLMAAISSTGVELWIHDTHFDHTNEVCPITKIMNFIPNLSYLALVLDKRKLISMN